MSKVDQNEYLKCDYCGRYFAEEELITKKDNSLICQSCLDMELDFSFDEEDTEYIYGYDGEY